MEAVRNAADVSVSALYCRGSPLAGRSSTAVLPSTCFTPSHSTRRAFTSSRIFVAAFVQPLYHASYDLTSTYGFRLGNDFWDVDEANPDASFCAIAEKVGREALPFFAQVTGLDRFCALVPAVGDGTTEEDHAGKLAR